VTIALMNGKEIACANPHRQRRWNGGGVEDRSWCGIDDPNVRASRAAAILRKVR
jgi:hypothetical protein